MKLAVLTSAAMAALLAGAPTTKSRAARPQPGVRVAFGTPPALRLFLHHVPAAGQAGREAVLFVHGATFPSALAAGYRLNGRSWMEDLAAAGFDVWALDFLGYGGSDRYPATNAAATERSPLLRAAEAADQLAAAVEAIRGTAGHDRVSIVAHSWGTLPAARYAALHPERVERLVLFGPLATHLAAVSMEPIGDGPATQEVTVADQWENFGVGIPPGEAPRLARATFDLWVAAYLDTDPASRTRTPAAVRVPFGPMADAADAERGVLPYEPADVLAPTLIVRGDWDAVSTDADCRALYARLGAQRKRYAVLARGTHRMHLEAGHRALWREVAAFLAGGDEE